MSDISVHLTSPMFRFGFHQLQRKMSLQLLDAQLCSTNCLLSAAEQEVNGGVFTARLMETQLLETTFQSFSF